MEPPLPSTYEKRLPRMLICTVVDSSSLRRYPSPLRSCPSPLRTRSAYLECWSARWWTARLPAARCSSLDTSRWRHSPASCVASAPWPRCGRRRACRRGHAPSSRRRSASPSGRCGTSRARLAGDPCGPRRSAGRPAGCGAPPRSSRSGSPRSAASRAELQEQNGGMVTEAASTVTTAAISYANEKSIFQFMGILTWHKWMKYANVKRHNLTK